MKPAYWVAIVCALIIAVGITAGAYLLAKPNPDDPTIVAACLARTPSDATSGGLALAVVRSWQWDYSTHTCKLVTA